MARDLGMTGEPLVKKSDARKQLQLVAEREAKHLETVEVSAQIDTQDRYVEAGELRKDIRRGQRAIEEAKKRIVEPLNEALRNVRSLFKPWEQIASLKLRAVDRAMDDFERREEQKRREHEEQLRRLQEKEHQKQAKKAEKRAAKAEEKGDLEKAAELRAESTLAPPPVVVPTSVPKVAGVTKRETWKFRFQPNGVEQQKQMLKKAIALYNAGVKPGEPELAGAEFWVLDEKTIGAVVRSTKGQIEIPGVDIYSETLRPTRAS